MRKPTDRELIKLAAAEFEITSLYHFTPAQNLSSICKRGLLSRLGLSEKAVSVTICDTLRLDGHRDAISLSVSLPNYKMFYRLRCDSDCDWAVVELRPDLLWELDCAFFGTNAASRRMSCLPLENCK